MKDNPYDPYRFQIDIVDTGIGTLRYKAEGTARAIYVHQVCEKEGHHELLSTILSMRGCTKIRQWLA